MDGGVKVTVHCATCGKLVREEGAMRTLLGQPYHTGCKTPEYQIQLTEADLVRILGAICLQPDAYISPQTLTIITGEICSETGWDAAGMLAKIHQILEEI
jgi:hypothetical protein